MYTSEITRGGGEMAWIKTISDEEAKELGGEYEEAFAKVREVTNSAVATTGGGPPGLSSLNPYAMMYAKQLMQHIMRGPSRVTTQQREMVATVTSLANNCKY